ncbi:hypothetical protein ZEAMMB73_Zm00001d016367, partial [Zea mays]
MVLLEERIYLCFLAFAENAFSTQVELAHGDRGQSYSYDRSSSYSSACRGGVSRRSNFRGCYGHWFTLIGIMARSEGPAGKNSLLHFRTTCGALVMYVSLMYTVRLENGCGHQSPMCPGYPPIVEE